MWERRSLRDAPGSSYERRSRRFWAVLLAACAAFVIALGGPERAATGIYNPIPADFAGDPQDLFVDDDYLFAYVTSDIKGGRICIVNASGSGNCDSPAWGDTNAVVGIGTVYTLIENPTLHVGTWRLRTENSVGELTGLSQPFTVNACPNCPKSIGASVAQEFKSRFAGMQLAADGYCFYQAAKDVVQEVHGIVGEMTAAHGNVLGLKKRHDEYRAGKRSFTATTVPVLAGFIPISFPATPGLVNPGEEKAKEILKALVCALDKVWDDVAKDPPDPAFDQIEQPTFSPIDPLGSQQTDALALSMDRQAGFSVAILRALERYQGALGASNQAGVHRQTLALSEFTRDLIDELRAGADALDAYAARLNTIPDFTKPVIPTALARSTLATIYARVRSDGFTAAELAELTGSGYTAQEIAEIRTHFDLNPAAAEIGVTLPQASRDFADELEAAIPALDALAREANAVAARSNLAPAAAFTATPQSGPAPLTVQFVDTSANPDSDPLTVTWSFGDGHSGSGASVSNTYTVEKTFVVTQQVCDYLACTSTSRVITVGPTTPANLPPVAADDTATAPQGVNTTINVRANDVDPDGDALQITGVTNPGHGSVTCFTSCSYTPDAGYLGPDSFEYTVVDGKGGADTATVSVTVTLRNRPPLARSDVLVTSQATAASINVLANDSDPDGDVLTITSNNEPFVADVTCTPAGICTFTPNAVFTGATSFNYTVSDGAFSAFTTVQVTVNPGSPPPNAPPTAVDDAVSAVAGSGPLSFSVLANDSDPDGDVVYLTGLAGTPSGNVTCTSAGSCTYTPPPGFLGLDEFGYTVADGRGGTDAATVEVTVLTDGVPPVVSLVMSPTGGFAPVGVSFDASGSHDPDGTVAAVRWSFGDGGTADGAQVSHTYAEPGTYSGTVAVTDDDGLTATLGFDFVAQDLEFTLELPICGDQDGSELPLVFDCTEYGPVQDVQLYRVEGTGNVEVGFDFVYRAAANDNELAVVPVDDATGAIDGVQPGDAGYYAKAFARAQVVFPSGSFAGTPDRTLTLPGGTLLMFMIASGTTVADVAASNPENERQGPLAFFSLDALNTDVVDHMMAYTRVADGRGEFGFEDLPGGGDRDYDDIVYTVDASLVPLGQLVVTKTADEPTTAAGGTNGYTITVANAATGAVVLESIEDTLPDGFAYVAGSTSGATTSNPTSTGSTVRWAGPFVIPRGETAQLHFDVRVSGQPGTYFNEATADADGVAVSATGPTAPVEVTPAAANNPPDAVPNTLTTAEDTAGDVQVLANDSDPDGDPLAVTTLSPAALHGTVSCTAVGVCTYSPAPNYHGPDSFTYGITDGRGGVDTASVAVAVTPRNDPPEAADDVLVTDAGTPGSKDVLANDSDPDGDGIVVTSASPAAAHGSVACTAGGVCTYTPAVGFHGPDSFEYSISDGHGGSATAAVHVTVRNRAPSASDGSFATDAGVPVAVPLAASDPDGDALSFVIVTPPGHGSLAGTGGSLTYTPAAGYSGPDSFTFRVNDGQTDSNTATVSITVRKMSHAPVAADQVTATDEGVAVQVTLGATDEDGDALSFSVVTGPGHGTLGAAAGDKVTYTPSPGYAGPDSFTFKANDGGLDSNVATVSITVHRAAAAPCGTCIVGPRTGTNLVMSGPTSVVAEGPLMLNGQAVSSGDARVTAPAIGVHGPPPIGRAFSPAPASLAEPVADPYALAPAPSTGVGPCRNVSARGTDRLTLEPGVYCTIAASGTSALTLGPGLYVVTGGINLSGGSSLHGLGATLYLACASFPSPCRAGGEAGASIGAGGTVTIELAAGDPAAPPPALFFDRGNTGAIGMSGEATADVTGGIYGRSAAARLSGSSAIRSRGASVVIAALSMSGHSSVVQSAS